jgi:hypothetical protein
MDAGSGGPRGEPPAREGKSPNCEVAHAKIIIRKIVFVRKVLSRRYDSSNASNVGSENGAQFGV